MKRKEFEAKIAGVENVDVMDFDLGSLCEFSRDNGNLSFKVGKEKPLVVGQDAYKKAASEIGITQSYAEKTPRELVLPHLNYWFQHKEGKLRVLYQKGGVIDFISTRITPISNRLLVDAAEEVMGKDVDFTGVYSDVNQTYFSILGPKTTDMKPSVGDIVRGGINIQNSLTGVYPLEITGYVYRLACDNGMFSAQSVFKWARRSEDVSNVREWAKGAVREAYDKVDLEFANIKKLQELSVEGFTADVLNDIFNEYGVAPAIRSEIMDKLVSDGGSTMYDVWNAITYVASHSQKMRSFQASRRMMSVAGDLVSNKRICDHCHSVISR